MPLSHLHKPSQSRFPWRLPPAEMPVGSGESTEAGHHLGLPGGSSGLAEPRWLHDFVLSPPSFQKSLKQRLGKSNIQARLGRPAGALVRGAMGGRGLPMGQRGLPRGAMRGGRGARALLRGGLPLRGQCLARCWPRHRLPRSLGLKADPAGIFFCVLQVRACSVGDEACPRGWA